MTYPRVQNWLSERMSLDASLLCGPGFEALVGERLRALGCPGEQDYLSVLGQSGEEAERLAGAIAVPETWLFRYPQSFALLVDELIGRRESGEARLSMMSVACAIGEEPYGMAMAALHAGWVAEAVQIDAFDRNASVLERARAGAYGSFSIRHELPSWAVPFLEHRGERIVVNDRVRSMVRFAQADVLQPGVLTSGGVRDVVFCRNLLIYLNTESRARLITTLREVLEEAGLLFVGHAEQMLCVSARMRRLDSPHAFALRAMSASTPIDSGVTVSRTAVMPSRSPMVARPAPVPAAIRMTTRVLEPAGTPERGLEDARALADAGQAAQSEELIRGILARKGPSADALELLGTLRQAGNDSVEARRLFEQALYLEPGRPTSLLQLAIIHEQCGDRAKAELMWARVRRATAPTQGGVR